MKIGGELIDFSEPVIMGILNLSPDSFFDGGRLNSDLDILNKVSSMMEEGADIIDVGAYSSRPGAQNITEKEEKDRLINPLSVIRKEFPDILVSVDTFRSGIAKSSVEAGANIINDISGGLFDEKMMELVARLKVPYILMHMKGNPQNMQDNPTYLNVVDEIYAFFSKQLNKAKKLGIHDIILDPGFGFGKNLEDNYRLMRSFNEFKTFNLMVLAGISRKSMVNKVIRSIPENSLSGTVALNTIALLNGADILRVHDVKAAKDAVKIVSYYQNS